MKKIIIFLLMVLVCSIMAFAATTGNHVNFILTDGTIGMNNTLLTGTNINCTDIAGASFNTCTGAGGGDTNTLYSNISSIGGLAITADGNFSLFNCTNDQIPKYVTDHWECAGDATGSGGKSSTGPELLNTTSAIGLNRTWYNANITLFLSDYLLTTLIDGIVSGNRSEVDSRSDDINSTAESNLVAIGNLETENNSINVAIGDLRAENITLWANLTINITNLYIAIADLQTENTSLNTAVSDLQADNVTLNASVTTLVAINHALFPTNNTEINMSNIITQNHFQINQSIVIRRNSTHVIY